MRIKVCSIIILILFGAVAAGCGLTGVTTTFSAADVTQPVLLGKMQGIHGTSNEQWQVKVPFDIRSSYGSVFPIVNTDDERAKVELLKLTDIAGGKIVIHEVSVGSISFLFVGPYSIAGGESSWVDISGGVFCGQAGK